VYPETKSISLEAMQRKLNPTGDKIASATKLK
jgi:hypothetical protein